MLLNSSVWRKSSSPQQPCLLHSALTLLRFYILIVHFLFKSFQKLSETLDYCGLYNAKSCIRDCRNSVDLYLKIQVGVVLLRKGLLSTVGNGPFCVTRLLLNFSQLHMFKQLIFACPDFQR